MLYQIPGFPVLVTLALDFGVLALLMQLWRHPRSGPARWSAAIGVVLVFLPLCGLKLLFGTPGSLASTPGQFTIRNPEHRHDRVYYLTQDQTGAWHVRWAEYMWGSAKTAVIEVEGTSAVQAAVWEAGQWHYTPIHFQELNTSPDLMLPHSFTQVDATGRIAAAVAAYRPTEYANLASALLTLSCVGLLGAVITRQFVQRQASRNQQPTRSVALS
ncbi:hypothetical protein [Hymenobacter pini]|uniref:hypothetical protein n=1 Tax=Hymenobacter pini TaxID=2880879 RepID=UPI001CF226AA|nr:hypothetical protein [Hymenobacter pini]MCA8832712.1 hypothetical protein [Hymenobacter pini]